MGKLPSVDVVQLQGLNALTRLPAVGIRGLRRNVVPTPPPPS